MLIKVNVDLCLGFISCPLNVLRKDRYNKKLKKYYVVYEENDTELSEDEERHERKDAEAPCFPLVRPPPYWSNCFSVSIRCRLRWIQVTSLGAAQVGIRF